MKILRSLSLLAACLFAASVTSCVSDGLTEPGNDVVGKEIATLEEQASSVMTTISDVKALKETIDGHEVELNGAIRSLESHVSYLSSGSSWEDATLATLAEQKKLAAVVGPILAQTDAASATKTTLNSLDANAKAWLGKNMGAYWSAVAVSAKSEAQLASYGKKLSMWKLQIEGIASDIEAGLKEGVDLVETDALLASVSAVVKASEDLNARLAALASDVEEGYQQAIATASEDPESFDAAALRSLNKAAAADLQDAGVTMNDLIDRVAACESEVTAMQERVGELEDKVADLEQLLDLIQSVTFLSEYSEDRIIAYYNLDSESEERTDEGYMLRTKAETIELNYVVRPASAAAALTESAIWNDGLKVIGYYASAITKAAPMTDFTITNVTADEGGIVTVTVANTLSDEFYFKKIGAKMALSIVSGKTDLTSKFVEIVPKDESNTVYAESLTVTESMEVEFGESAVIKAVLNPLGADQSVVWESDNEDVVTVSSEGVLTTKGVGTANVTATSVTTDEYGRKLSATCNVTVNPDIKIVGPKFVEEGYSINLRLDCPRNINPEQITWTVSNPSAVTVQKTTVDGMNCAVVTGNAVAYNGGYEDITITCAIAGETTLTHTIQCVEVQPRDIDITGLTVEENENNEITLKFGQSRTFGASILPNTVDAEKFTLSYGHSGEGLTRSNQTITAQDENTLKNGKVTGYFNVEVNSDWYWYDKTFQTIADKITRKITVNVEPYYITDLSIPASQNMTVDQVLNELPDITFTSDDPPQVPSYTDLTWTSSASEYVSVNETTGQLTARQVTTEPVKITASIKNPEISVKPGDTVADAYCYVTVTEAAASDPKIGDYYFADGTFATDLPDGYDHATSDNKVIGIIFYLGNVTEYDTRLVTDGYGSCVHGLVVSVDEYTSYPGTFESYNIFASIMTYPFDEASITGYTNTVQLSEYGVKKGSGYAKMYRYDSEGVPGVHESTVPHPTTASPWYIPSFAEMKAIHDKLSVLNTSLSALDGASSISKSEYWVSTFKKHSSRNELDYHYTYSLSSNGWGTRRGGSYSYSSSNEPVRLILAF